MTKSHEATVLAVGIYGTYLGSVGLGLVKVLNCLALLGRSSFELADQACTVLK